jgi:hypothetical protein
MFGTTSMEIADLRKDVARLQRELDDFKFQIRTQSPKKEVMWFSAFPTGDTAIAVPLEDVVKAILAKLRLRVVRGEPFTLIDEE